MDSDEKADQHYQHLAKHLVEYLFTDTVFDYSKVSLDALYSVLVKKDRKLLSAVRREIQNSLDDIWDELTALPMIDHLKYEILVCHVLTMYAYFEPQQDEILHVPTKLNQGWHLLPYQVDRLKLTSKMVSSPYYAYGLAPMHYGPAKLLYMGTNVAPTHNGTHATWIADFWPGRNVGDYIIHQGMKVLEDWILRHSTHEYKVRALGLSLGGSLALLSHIHFPHHIDAYAYNPAFLTEKTKDKYHENVGVQSHGFRKDSVNIFIHKEDHVPKVGRWIPRHANIYILDAGSHSTVSTHIKGFANCRNVDIVPGTLHDEVTHQKRWVMNKLWRFSSLFVGGYNIFQVLLNMTWRLPYFYGYKKLLQPWLGATESNPESLENQPPPLTLQYQRKPSVKAIEMKNDEDTECDSVLTRIARTP